MNHYRSLQLMTWVFGFICAIDLTYYVKKLITLIGQLYNHQLQFVDKYKEAINNYIVEQMYAVDQLDPAIIAFPLKCIVSIF